jgi:hypothetical protein
VSPNAKACYVGSSYAVCEGKLDHCYDVNFLMAHSETIFWGYPGVMDSMSF